MHKKEQTISFTHLANGERIGLAAVEITTVPHLSILQKRFSAVANIDTGYKQDMARLLSEVFQNYKSASAGCKDISPRNFIISIEFMPRISDVFAVSLPRILTGKMKWKSNPHILKEK